ncbi:hypothetical protein [Klebsiella pneumoniae]|uniref:hypothetical protein n=1 Tax=Klebsiella pneumoniae TaxID=573 RepID=UPI0007E91A60|nr:hypothetical protein [Klebsiella pneumoniae]MDX7176157.1 hypothetical protein [Klebsiella pneumoniae]MDX7269581.1 hypothetical protein [Klebsiella pneumoniae]QBQ71784.1 hypothetical protein [Klebsiella phage ST11-OXA245phi3.2]SYO19907.1 Uncharacterised protein [Klebsiella pneumoniae]
MTDITELAQREKFENWARSQQLSLAYGDCGYFYSSTEMAWRAVKAQSAELVEALEKAQQRNAELESRTVNVKLPATIEPTAFSPWVAKAFYQFHKDTVKSCFAVFSDACAAAGIKVEAE